MFVRTGCRRNANSHHHHRRRSVPGRRPSGGRCCLHCRQAILLRLRATEDALAAAAEAGDVHPGRVGQDSPDEEARHGHGTETCHAEDRRSQALGKCRQDRNET